MGQYHKVANLDKQQYLNPHQFGDGLKLMEFGCSSQGTLSALASMLIVDRQQVSPWAGDRLTITGDYGDEGRFVPKEFEDVNLYVLLNYEEYTEEEEGDTPALTDGTSEAADKPAKRVAPVWTALKTECEEQLKGLGFPMTFGRFGTSGLSIVEGDKTFEQFEDVLEGFGLGVREALMESFRDCLTLIRCSKYSNPLSWCDIATIDVKQDLATGDITQIRVGFVSRQDAVDKNYLPSHFARTLAFPATTQSVLDFFMVKEPVPQLPAK